MIINRMDGLRERNLTRHHFSNATTDNPTADSVIFKHFRFNINYW